MRIRLLAPLIGGGLMLAACTETNAPVAAAPPAGPGAIAGTVAADRNGDGIPDGYYTPDGIYHPFAAPPCPPPPPPPPPCPPTPRGERG